MTEYDNEQAELALLRRIAEAAVVVTDAANWKAPWTWDIKQWDALDDALRAWKEAKR